MSGCIRHWVSYGHMVIAVLVLESRVLVRRTDERGTRLHILWLFVVTDGIVLMTIATTHHTIIDILLFEYNKSKLLANSYYPILHPYHHTQYNCIRLEVSIQKSDITLRPHCTSKILW